MGATPTPGQPLPELKAEHMHPTPIRFGLAVALLLAMGCGSETVGPSAEDESGDPVPAGLSLEVTLQGQPDDPEGDGSGVAFLRASATNAVRYRFEFQGGRFAESASGELTHTFTEPGTRERRIRVLAFSETGNAVDLAVDVTVRVDTPVEPGPGETEMTLVWADEFDYTGPIDPAKWHHQVIPIQGDSWANGEEQHYTDRTDNSYVSEGTLKIVARREDYTFGGVTKAYTSARLNSKFDFQYGRVDIRARLPIQAGTWPALWTLGANINEVGNFHGTTYGDVGWPACGEIDILEQTGWDKNSVIGHLHWGDTRTGQYENMGGTLAVANTSTAFNLYSLVWTDGEIRMLFNDQVVYETPITEGMPYDNPHYLLLNIAMGGNLGGDIPAGFSEAVMEIDYVRIYQ